MRTVCLYERTGFSIKGETIALAGFDPSKGVVVVTANSTGDNYLPIYEVVGDYPNAAVKFPAIDPELYAYFGVSTQTYLILAVHYK